MDMETQIDAKQPTENPVVPEHKPTAPPVHHPTASEANLFSSNLFAKSSGRDFTDMNLDTVGIPL
jgi:hypothetical protein